MWIYKICISNIRNTFAKIQNNFFSKIQIDISKIRNNLLNNYLKILINFYEYTKYYFEIIFTVTCHRAGSVDSAKLMHHISFCLYTEMTSFEITKYTNTRVTLRIPYDSDKESSISVYIMIKIHIGYPRLIKQIYL